MWCILGLGNPGIRYRNTRHNLGFMVVDEMARRWNAPWRERDLYHEARISLPSPAVLVKPQTFMNLSGQAAAQLNRHRRIAIGNILAVCDDLSLPLGTLRLRASGSDGGQKGLRSLIEGLGSKDFPRLRLGIGPLPQGWEAASYVLSPFAPDERDTCRLMLCRACEAIESILESGLEKTMNQINRKTKEEPR